MLLVARPNVNGIAGFKCKGENGAGFKSKVRWYYWLQVQGENGAVGCKSKVPVARAG